MVGFLSCVGGNLAGAGGAGWGVDEISWLSLVGWSGNFFNRSPIILKFEAEN